MGCGCVDRDLAGEDDLLEGSRADAFDGPGDGGLVVLGGGDGVDPEAARRVRGRAAAAGRGAGRRLGRRGGRRAPPGRRRVRRARRRSAGRRRRGGRGRPPGRSGRRRRTRTSAARGRRWGRRRTRRGRARPAPGGPSGASATAPAVRSRQAAATRLKRSGPEAVSRVTVPSAAMAEPLRSGCSKQNQSSPGTGRRRRRRSGRRPRRRGPCGRAGPDGRCGARGGPRARRCLSRAGASTASPPPGVRGPTVTRERLGNGAGGRE